MLRISDIVEFAFGKQKIKSSQGVKIIPLFILLWRCFASLIPFNSPSANRKSKAHRGWRSFRFRFSLGDASHLWYNLVRFANRKSKARALPNNDGRFRFSLGDAVCISDIMEFAFGKQKIKSSRLHGLKIKSS